MRAIIIAAISASVIVAAVVLFISSFHVDKYSLSVDPIESKKGERVAKRVVLRNTGMMPLTNLRIDYGYGHVETLSILEAGQKVFLSPPENSSESVTVTTDEGIRVTESYRAPIGLVPPGFS